MTDSMRGTWLCNHAGRGCSFVGELDDARAHEETCEHRPRTVVVANYHEQVAAANQWLEEQVRALVSSDETAVAEAMRTQMIEFYAEDAVL